VTVVRLVFAAEQDCVVKQFLRDGVLNATMLHQFQETVFVGCPAGAALLVVVEQLLLALDLLVDRPHRDGAGHLTRRVSAHSVRDDEESELLVDEEVVLVDKKLSLFVVADGMGGHASGAVASQMAVHELRNAVDAGREAIARFGKGDPAAQQDILNLLEHAVQSACQAIYLKGQAEPEKRGMGTTTSALLIAGDRGFIAHVGDSRIYLLRGGQVIQLTEDHSLVNELIRRGRVTKEGFETSPYKAYKNAVTRAVGVYETVQGDTFDFEILPGDQFLLCSDGLTTMVDTGTISAILQRNRGHLDAATHDLIKAANDRGGDDNITAILFAIGEGDPAGPAPPGPRAKAPSVAAEQRGSEARRPRGRPPPVHLARKARHVLGLADAAAVQQAP